MTDFASTPPSRAKDAPEGMFQRGMVPVDPIGIASLIVFDIRALKLSVDEGRELEGQLRETLFKMLDGRTKGLSERSAADLGGTVLGIAIE
ncbi:hypothetical protein [uncultured Hoeflea sp.]|uniref:hypothetical protein n=1 Tax=uncultured Hoeflea sp. TaxID=538666 RepID=UPI0026382C52|nr:hypothetical protein [uncultured Hoeflea sp.]